MMLCSFGSSGRAATQLACPQPLLFTMAASNPLPRMNSNAMGAPVTTA